MTSLIDFYGQTDFEMSFFIEEDADEVIRLINKAFSYQDEAKGRERINKEELDKKVSETEFYLVKKGKQLVACVSLEVKDEFLHIGLLSVTDGFGGGKLAPYILASIEEYAKGLNLNKINLSYGTASPWLKKYYERYGFTENGRQVDLGWSELIEMVKEL